MPKIRVLVVDDAVVFRRMVSDVLSGDPDLEVAGTAANGKIALAKIPQLNPDLVVLDVEMPELDGLQTLAELRKSWPRLPVIMFSSLTHRGAMATMEALSLGASDYFTKPADVRGLEGSLQVVREELLPKIKMLCSRILNAPPPVAEGAAPIARSADSPRTPIEAVVIGSSTGGPNALAEVFSAIPREFPVPILIVQHMPPMFTRLLAERLAAQYLLPVNEATSGTAVEPGCIWVAPGDHHMVVVRDAARARLLVHRDPPENSCRPSVDVLFRSAARAYGPSCLAVVLTGMGQDGLRGCEAIREAGGQIIVQDEATSVVWGMPGYVARAGLADKVLPLKEIGVQIMQRIRAGRNTGSASGS